MRVYLIDQSKNFPQQLEFFKRQPVMQYEKLSMTEKSSTIQIEKINDFQDLKTDFFFNYNIFPRSIMSYLTQWNCEERQMKIGDTIVQQAFIPPFGQLSQKIVVGVRINEIIKEPGRIGFSYETLEGHVEKGISIFTIEKTSDQKTIFKVHTFSRPGNLLTRFLGPVFSIPYQAFCTQKALVNVKRQLETSL
jgi:hypothetical protein